MTLKELYNLKLYEYKETGLRDKPGKLLAMLMLPKKDNYAPIRVTEGEFYKIYKEQIDKNIAKVEEDFEFTREDIKDFIEETFECKDYEYQKIWDVFSEGFSSMHWGLMYQKDATPEEIFSKYFNTNELKKKYSIEEQAVANNIKVTKLDNLINRIIDLPEQFYIKISQELTPEERCFIINNLSNKDCMNCTNGSCNISIVEKVGLDELGKTQGNECIGWNNDELIGMAKVLKY